MATILWIANETAPIQKMTQSYADNGDEQLKFQLPIRKYPPKLRSKVYLEDSVYGYHWLGYLGTYTPNKNTGCADVIARGMYKTAEDFRYYENKIFRAGSPAEDMVLNALSKCSNIQDGDLIDDLTFQLVEDSSGFGLQTPADVFRYAQQLTGYLSTPINWQVLQDPANPQGTPSPVLKIAATDYAPRYRVRLSKRDEFTPTYDADVIYNVGLDRWGNEQYQAATNNGISNTQLPQNPDITITIPQIDYSVIPDARYKGMDVSGTVSNLREVQQLAGYLVNRYNVLRPVSSRLVIDSATVIESIYPQIIASNLPHNLVRSHVGIEILNDLTDWGMYGITTFYITAAEYDYDTCKLTLTLGDPVLQDTFRLLGSYDVSREYIGAQASKINLVHRDADVLVEYGTVFDGRTGQEATNPDDATMLNNFSVGVVQGISTIEASTSAPRFTDPNNALYMPTGKAINPLIQADYGTQANFGREATSTGVKGFIKLIPQKVTEWEIAFLAPPGSDVIPTQSIEIEFYQVYPFTVGSDTPFATKAITNAQSGSGTFTGTELVNFSQGGKVGIRVSQIGTTALGTGTPTANSMFQVTVTGRKLYPALGIVS